MKTKYKTRIVEYNSKPEMDQGIQQMEDQGWEVVSSEVVKGNYSASKTCCLGLIFLPLALLGKKSDTYKVQFRRK